MKNTILWLIQTNQITPIIVEFLETLQKRVENYIDLRFIVPESSSNILEKLKNLNPILVKATTRIAKQPLKVYQSKKEALSKQAFSEGLLFADVLILDDLGGGRGQQTTLEIPLSKDTCGLIIQVPTPLGSSDTEEKIFHSAILWGTHNKIPVLGYELLPLDTKWTLAPSLPNGVITRRHDSYAHLKNQLPHDNTWLLPLYEAAIFSSMSTKFHLNGARSCYHHRNEHSIPASKTILYLPHNVAMVYEYHKIIKMLTPLGEHLHLMFGIGKDQVRGAYDQKQVIEKIYTKELKSYFSYSFHDINASWEMMLADVILAAASCFNTEIAEKELPCLIFDPQLPPMVEGKKKRIATGTALLEAINQTIQHHECKTEFSDILMMMTIIGKKDD